ncbi:hypothetical protein J6590_037926 [Homalodisca vitripennis]|nr:hypothetical protein J6590_037926 [Homalodisca vitripennis]
MTDCSTQNQTFLCTLEDLSHHTTLNMPFGNWSYFVYWFLGKTTWFKLLHITPSTTKVHMEVLQELLILWQLYAAEMLGPNLSSMIALVGGKSRAKQSYCSLNRPISYHEKESCTTRSCTTRKLHHISSYLMRRKDRVRRENYIISLLPDASKGSCTARKLHHISSCLMRRKDRVRRENYIISQLPDTSKGSCTARKLHHISSCLMRRKDRYDDVLVFAGKVLSLPCECEVLTPPPSLGLVALVQQVLDLSSGRPRYFHADVVLSLPQLIQKCIRLLGISQAKKHFIVFRAQLKVNRCFSVFSHDRRPSSSDSSRREQDK